MKDAWNSWQIAESAIDTHTSVELAQMFHFACLIGYSEKAVMLYRLIHDVMQSGNFLCNPADIAADLARTGHLDTLQRLEEIGFDLVPHLDAALLLAAEFGHADFALYLTQRGADASAYDAKALWHAVEKNHAGMLDDLLSYRSYPADLLHDIAAEAVVNIRTDILDVIFKHGFDIHHKEESLLCKALSVNRTYPRMLDYLHAHGATVMQHEELPLQKAIAQVSLRHVEWALFHGADPLFLPPKPYESGMKSTVLSGVLRRAMAFRMQEARDLFDPAAWKDVAAAPHADDMLAAAIRGGSLRLAIDAIIAQPRARDSLINESALQSPINGRSLTMLDMIIRTGQHKALCDARLWRGRMAELERIVALLPENLRTDIGTGVFDDLKEYDRADQRRIALKSKRHGFPPPR